MTNLAENCLHCGAASGAQFCCPGCAAAYSLIEDLGLRRYYQTRALDAAARPLRPEESPERPDFDRFIAPIEGDALRLDAMIEGVQCGACVWLIESLLSREGSVVQGRVNMTTRRLRLVWRGAASEGLRLIETIERLGYRLIPFDPASIATASEQTARALTRALAVAGFAAGNIMLLSIGVWVGRDEMTPAIRDLLHWISAMIALPAIAYAGHPFFTSAWRAVRHGRTNMDLPISVGVLLVAVLSLSQTMAGGEDVYFDSATMLLFFLLIGRVLDTQARGRARMAAERLMALRAVSVSLMTPDGGVRRCPVEQIQPGWHMLVAVGERLGVDGRVVRGHSAIDQSLITGESLPRRVAAGADVFAGTLNLDEPLVVEATATADASILANCVQLMEAALSRRGRFIVLADRIARLYAPVVHLTALATALFWHYALGAGWMVAILNATAVLIITCPCALALAVPTVQVIVTGRLFRAGILLKSATALERLATVDHVVFDKTGTLGQPELALMARADDHDAAERRAALAIALSLAAASRHPLARALLGGDNPGPGPDFAPVENIRELPGQGMTGEFAFGTARLGSAAFCGLASDDADTPEIWLSQPRAAPVRFQFTEQPRPDAAKVVERLRHLGVGVSLLSGDRSEAVARMAQTVGIGDWQGEVGPAEKLQALEARAAKGLRVLMVGDGLNDGPALAGAFVSMSPSTAQDISQNAADIVFQGVLLAPVAQIIETARRARRIIQQNIAFAIFYNITFIPLAMVGRVTPWLAAAAMSASSIIVLANSFRAAR